MQVETALHSGRVQSSGDLGLSLEALEYLWIPEEQGIRRLEHDHAAGQSVASFVGFGIGPFAKLRHDLIVVDSLARLIPHIALRPRTETKTKYNSRVLAPRPTAGRCSRHGRSTRMSGTLGRIVEAGA